MTLRVLRPTLLTAALLALAALLAAPAGALAAKTRTKVYPAQTMALLKAKGTHGWRVQIDAIAFGGRRGSEPVGVYASGPHHQTVSYQGFPSSFAKDGTLKAKLPGVGRIDLTFEATSHQTVHIDNPKSCTSAPTTVDSEGVFRGTIELHGEGGYTTVALRSAPGELSTYPRQTCRVRTFKRAREEAEAEGETAKFEDLYAEREWGSGNLNFEATSFPTELKGLPPRHVEFSADYSHHRDGMWVDASTRVEGEAKDFTVVAPEGAASEATVTPPGPFAGSAEFSLESPTVADWSGDLRVPIPTLGTVDLTAPAFGAMLCVDNECTKTLPGVSVIFSVGSFG